MQRILIAEKAVSTPGSGRGEDQPVATSRFGRSDEPVWRDVARFLIAMPAGAARQRQWPGPRSRS